MTKSNAVALTAFFLLAACGGSEPAENAADRLDEAADQSGPAAEQVLENSADALRDAGNVNAAEADAAAQQALNEAGDAQLGNTQ